MGGILKPETVTFGGPTASSCAAVSLDLIAFLVPAVP